jgi:secreted PhoX family phosphatase
MRTTISSFVLREESEDVGRNPTDNPTLGDVIAARYARRDILKGALGVAAIATAVSPLALAAAGSARAETASRYRFDELEAGADENHHVAPGYDADILIRWGDPVLGGAPPFNPAAHTPAAQRLQFGYNSDYLAYFPMPGAANP